MQSPIFGISGLRGIVGKDLLPKTAFAAASAFGRLCGGTVAVGRDARASGAMLEAAALSGLTRAGSRAVRLGICPTPTVLHYVRRHELAGGIVITASHNPEQWNGMKFCSPDGTFLRSAAVARLRALFEAGTPPSPSPSPFTGEGTEPSPSPSPFKGEGTEGRGKEGVEHQASSVVPGAVAGHIADVVNSPLFKGVRKRLRAGVDAVNGAASVAGPELVKAFGCEPVCVNCNPSAAATFPRRPEPMPDHLTALCTLVREQKLDLGIAFDPDGDRFSCVDETGTALGEEATICLALLHVLPRKPGKVVVNLSTTRAVEDVCSRFGVPVERTPVGEVSVLERMLATGAVVGGEGNGGVILPEVNPTRDGLVATAIVLGLAAQKPLSEWRKDLPQYSMVKGKLDAAGSTLDAGRRARLLAAFNPTRVDETDGLWLGGADWWLHVRPSNTEPVVRIIAEAPTRERAREIDRLARTLLAEAKE